MRVIHAQAAPSNPQRRNKAMAAGLGVALSILSLGLLVWMALDVDGDGRASYAELSDGTSPFNGDSDGDGVADGWELEHGYDALSAASVPDVQRVEEPDRLHELEECRIGDLTAEGCSSDSSGSRSGVPETEADIPPAGGHGGAGSLVIGGATTLVAGVAARLVSSAILHKP